MMNVVAKAAIARSLGGRTSQRPAAAEATNHGPATMAAAASAAPPEFDRTDANHCPRTACDQDVVMPHDGQRMPNNQMKVQGGSPNC